MCRYPDLQLYSTVFHVWGKLNRTFDRGAQGENLLDYFDQYVKWTDPSKPNFLQVGKVVGKVGVMYWSVCLYRLLGCWGMNSRGQGLVFVHMTGIQV